MPTKKQLLPHKHTEILYMAPNILSEIIPYNRNKVTPNFVDSYKISLEETMES